MTVPTPTDCLLVNDIIDFNHRTSRRKPTARKGIVVHITPLHVYYADPDRDGAVRKVWLRHISNIRRYV